MFLKYFRNKLIFKELKKDILKEIQKASRKGERHIEIDIGEYLYSKDLQKEFTRELIDYIYAIGCLRISGPLNGTLFIGW